MIEKNELIPFCAIENLSFQKRPKLISPDLRYFRRLSLIILILMYTARNHQMSLLKIQFFNWAMASSRNMKLSRAYLNDPMTIKSNIISFDPSLNRAIDMAIGDDFIEFKTGVFRLTAKGEQFFHYLVNDNNLLTSEKEYLQAVCSRSISEKQIESIIKGIY